MVVLTYSAQMNYQLPSTNYQLERKEMVTEMKIVLGLMMPLACLAAPFATFPDGCVTPDGMTVDAQDLSLIHI